MVNLTKKVKKMKEIANSEKIVMKKWSITGANGKFEKYTWFIKKHKNIQFF